MKEQYRNNIDRCKFQNPTHFSLLNLYRSIIVIMDHFVSSFNHHGSIRHKTCIALEDYAQFQTVLITCTSLKEEELKAPISFESPKAHCLPLQRSDTHGFETVRVSLATAIRFITDLEKRENPELMKHTPRDPKLRLRTCTSTSPEFEGYIQDCPEAWAKACIEEAEIVGFDNIHQTWRSIRRVKAASNGETFWELAPELFRENWKEYSGQPWNYLEERLSNDNSNNWIFLLVHQSRTQKHHSSPLPTTVNDQIPSLNTTETLDDQYFTISKTYEKPTWNDARLELPVWTVSCCKSLCIESKIPHCMSCYLNEKMLYNQYNTIELAQADPIAESTSKGTCLFRLKDV